MHIPVNSLLGVKEILEAEVMSMYKVHNGSCRSPTERSSKTKDFQILLLFQEDFSESKCC